MSKFQKFPIPNNAILKALIIYDDCGSAARANAALRQSARNVDASMQWNVIPWRMEMLKCPATAEEMLADALDADLVVIAGLSTQSTSAELKSWLNHWAKSHRIKGAALALFGFRSAHALAGPASHEFSRVASRHGLGFIFDDCRNREDRPNIVELSSAEFGPLPSTMPQPNVDAQIHHPHRHWGINE